MTSRTCRRCEISKKLTWNPTLTAKNTPLFLFPYMGHSLQIFAWGMPLHAHVFSFTHNAVVLSAFRCVHHRKSDEKFTILTFLWIKINVAYTRLEVIATQHSALQVEFITSVKLICYFVLYYCFLHWSHLPNMAVGDLAFYYTLYLWFGLAWAMFNSIGLGDIQYYITPLFFLFKAQWTAARKLQPYKTIALQLHVQM